MSRGSTIFPASLAIALLSLLLLQPFISQAAPARHSPHVELAVSFEPGQNLLRGTAKITIPAETDLAVHLDDLQVTAALLSRPGRENRPLLIGTARTVPLQATGEQQTLLLSYEKEVVNSAVDTIGDHAIILTSAWHPRPDRPAFFSLAARLPHGFIAVSESDELAEADDDGWVRFSFSHPVRSLHLAAAPYQRTDRSVRPGLSVSTYFLPGQAELADAYLESAVGYLRRYEALIGPFPYQHYAIVENPKPTGIGLPTFTLLGSQVIRLPFIRHTSLGHEILHSWFGNSIEVAAGSGNWAEGLTTYLADLAYRDDAGEGALARKEALLAYQNYVKPSPPPLRSFIGAGHDRLYNRDQRAVGYTRAALLFHELRTRIGTDSFTAGIRRFYGAFRDQAASWDDVERIFSEQSGQSLHRFFAERLERNDLPELSVKAVTTRELADATELSFTIVQHQPEPYQLLVPVTIETGGATLNEYHLVEERESTLTIRLSSPPLSFTIDPEYHLARVLSPAERWPAWSQVMGSDRVLVIRGDRAGSDSYDPLIDLAKRLSWPVVDRETIDDSALAGKDLVILGVDNLLVRGLFGPPDLPDDGMTVQLRMHPLYPERIVALVSSSNVQETRAVVDRLSHYGTESYLHFRQGRLIERSSKASTEGIRTVLLERPAGLQLAQLNTFEQLVDQLSDHRVIFIGETHTSWADHLLQALLIEALHRRKPKLAIGMEMFPVSSQAALDRYIFDPGWSEAAFLKESRYHQVWGYDYRLFRPIFALARSLRIPVIGLNVERQIASSIYSSGGIAALPEEQRATLPVDRALDLPGYRERLDAVHRQHAGNSEAGRSLQSFMEAQVIWDEGMAETAARYLAANPDTTLVILTGTQHARRDSGIPPRLARRLPVSQATVANLAGQSAAELQATVDYLFFLESEDLPETGKIGATLQEEPNQSGLTVVALDPRSRSGEAGLQEGDRLIAIDGAPLAEMTDVRIAMLDKRPGEILPITVERVTDDGTRETLQLQVVLSDLARVPRGDRQP